MDAFEMNPEARRMLLRIRRGCEEHESASSTSSNGEDVRVLSNAVLTGDLLELGYIKIPPAVRFVWKRARLSDFFLYHGPAS
eukprot:54933-Chlamydomonas_euryale.AAC.1